ncbi:MAG: helix-turn-helix domain-containing protein [Chloroflexota bacterium]
MNVNTERLLPILIHIQAHLDGDLSLDILAERAELSSFHFHRIFRDTVGETVKQYVQRLRLERAAYLLKIQNASVIDIAFSLGYQTHETFSRAFRRQFGTTPMIYRQSNRLTHHLAPHSEPEQDHISSASLNEQTLHYEISNVQTCTLDAIGVAFIRSLGDYVEADANSFDQLITWAKEKSHFRGDNLLIGIGHDDPNVTPKEKVRYDACIEVTQPFVSDGDIGYQTTLPGRYAAVTYVGPFGETMYQAYGTIFHHIQNHPKYTLIGLPAIEIYRTTQINPDYQLNQVDIYMPIEENL